MTQGAQNRHDVGVRDVGIALVVVAIGQPLGAILVLVWARWSNLPWRDLGFVRPKSWLATFALGIAFGIAFKLFMKSIVMPLLGADPINQHYQHLAGNPSAIAGMLFIIIAGAGFGEETVFRGYLFERLKRLLGHSTGATIAIVVLTAVLFGALHYPDQGIDGVKQATIFGLVFGLIFAKTGRIVLLMVAHAAFDLTALAVIYWRLEETVAHWFFK